MNFWPITLHTFPQQALTIQSSHFSSGHTSKQKIPPNNHDPLHIKWYEFLYGEYEGIECWAASTPQEADPRSFEEIAEPPGYSELRSSDVASNRTHVFTSSSTYITMNADNTNEFEAEMNDDLRKENEEMAKDGAFDDVVADSLKEKEEIPY